MSSKILYALPKTNDERIVQVRRLLEAKEKSGLSFGEIAQRCQITNVYCANVFYGRSCVNDETATKLKNAIPALTDDDIQSLKRAPMRHYDEQQFQDPLVYRLHEAVVQYGEAIKALINEEFGDGVISAIDCYAQVEKVIGPNGEARAKISFNGKFLPHMVQDTGALEKMKIA